MSWPSLRKARATGMGKVTKGLASLFKVNYKTPYIVYGKL